jgi:hypothetical protein
VTDVFQKRTKTDAEVSKEPGVVIEHPDKPEPLPPPPPPTTMGGCVSTADQAGKERSDEIDRQLEEDCKRFKRECKILLLGLSS